MAYMQISKLDAAKRQLDSAISLYFKNTDPVSIHTLTAAAHQILMDICKIQGIRSVVKDVSCGLIRQGKEKEYLSIINESENFFKHANRDPQELLEFNPEQTDFLLIDAVEMYMQLTNEMPEDMSVYRVWFLIKYPDIISDKAQQNLKNMNLHHRLQVYRNMSKVEFYKTMKEAAISFR